MSDKVFLDANILVYAHDKDAGEKHRISFWDALVIVAAYDAKCENFWHHLWQTTFSAESIVQM